MAEYSLEERRRLEAEGKTAYGTSYPLDTCEDVKNAIISYGRAPEEHRAELRAKIARRRAELGCDVELPETWHV